MSIELDDSYGPGFDYHPYQRDCPRDCAGRVEFHYCRVHDGTHGNNLDNAHSLDIITKCHVCGHLDTAQPPITPEQFDWFRERWGGMAYLPWSEETGDGRQEMDDVYSEENARKLRERLDDLGYI